MAKARLIRHAFTNLSEKGLTQETVDIFRRHGEAFRQAHAGHLGRVEHRAMGAITACRTVALLQLGSTTANCGG